MRSTTLLTIVLVIIMTSVLAVSATVASGSNGADKIFKSWQSLIQPIFDLQNRVSQLEQENEALQNRVNELEDKVDSSLPPPAPQYVIFNIDVDQVTHTYGATDTVVFHGVVSPVVEGKTASIRIYDPSGSQIDASTDTPNDQGDFYGDAFDIPSGSDDGVWTVKATYNGWDAYSYFIVDDETDDISVNVNNIDRQYGAGDEVTITGHVDHIQTGESEVLITVIDPHNDNIVDQEPSELGAGTLADDEFKFSFNLDDAASPGRYAIIVTYDIDNQEGTTLFEIPRSDNSGGNAFTGDSDTDGNLAAQVQRDSYRTGDVVAIQGSIENYDSADAEDLVITVKDPDGVKIGDYSDSSATVESSGDFTYDFELNEDAAPGVYSVAMTYSSDQVHLTFETEN